jgi:hypothetical protein
VSKARMETQAPRTGDMPGEIDFSKGMRGKFAKPGAKVVLPVYVDKEAQVDPPTMASEKSCTRND